MNTIKGWDKLLLEGVSLINYIVSQKNPWEITKWDFLDEFKIPKQWGKEKLLLTEDYQLFLKDLDESKLEEIFAPQLNNIAVKSKVLIFNKPTQCKLHKYWAREKIVPAILMIPFVTGNNEEKIDRVIISTDPISHYFLPQLGYMLEHKETEKREKIGAQRIGYPRFEPEYCDNNDPWYDGRGHEFTIVDSPRVGSKLSYQEIQETVLSLYSKENKFDIRKTGIDAFISYRRSGGSELAWTLRTLLTHKYKKYAFLDVENLVNGQFDEQLKSNLEKCKNFIVILSPGALKRCSNPCDWVRQEIEMAIKLEKNIIPVMVDGFDYSSFDQLPESMSALQTKNGVLLKHEYYQEGIQKIVNFMID